MGKLGGSPCQKSPESVAVKIKKKGKSKFTEL